MTANYLNHKTDRSASWSAAFYMANLLFVGVFYLALWLLYFLRYKKAAPLVQNHIKQALVASTISTLVFAAINLTIMYTGGYDNVRALIALETYFMGIVPLFFIVGILAFIKAVSNADYRYPIIGRFMRLHSRSRFPS